MPPTPVPSLNSARAPDKPSGGWASMPSAVRAAGKRFKAALQSARHPMDASSGPKAATIASSVQDPDPLSYIGTVKEVVRAPGGRRFDRIAIAHDGDCLFNAVLHGLGSDADAGTMRREVSRYIENNKKALAGDKEIVAALQQNAIEESRQVQHTFAQGEDVDNDSFQTYMVLRDASKAHMDALGKDIQTPANGADLTDELSIRALASRLGHPIKIFKLNDADGLKTYDISATYEPLPGVRNKAKGALPITLLRDGDKFSVLARSDGNATLQDARKLDAYSTTVDESVARGGTTTDRGTLCNAVAVALLSVDPGRLTGRRHTAQSLRSEAGKFLCKNSKNLAKSAEVQSLALQSADRSILDHVNSALIDEYAHYVRQDTRWAGPLGDLAPHLVARAMDCDVVVYNLADGHLRESQACPARPSGRPSGQCVRILHDSDHYDALTPTGETGRTHARGRGLDRTGEVHSEATRGMLESLQSFSETIDDIIQLLTRMLGVLTKAGGKGDDDGGPSSARSAPDRTKGRVDSDRGSGPPSMTRSLNRDSAGPRMPWPGAKPMDSDEAAGGGSKTGPRFTPWPTWPTPGEGTENADGDRGSGLPSMLRSSSREGLDTRTPWLETRSMGGEATVDEGLRTGPRLAPLSSRRTPEDRATGATLWPAESGRTVRTEDNLDRRHSGSLDAFSLKPHPSRSPFSDGFGSIPFDAPSFRPDTPESDPGVADPEQLSASLRHTGDVLTDILGAESGFMTAVNGALQSAAGASPAGGSGQDLSTLIGLLKRTIGEMCGYLDRAASEARADKEAVIRKSQAVAAQIQELQQLLDRLKTEMADRGSSLGDEDRAQLQEAIDELSTMIQSRSKEAAFLGARLPGEQETTGSPTPSLSATIGAKTPPAVQPRS